MIFLVIFQCSSQSLREIQNVWPIGNIRFLPAKNSCHNVLNDSSAFVKYIFLSPIPKYDHCEKHTTVWHEARHFYSLKHLMLNLKNVKGQWPLLNMLDFCLWSLQESTCITDVTSKKCKKRSNSSNKNISY